MNCTPESSIGYNSNWQLSSLFPYNKLHTNVPVNMTQSLVLTVLSNEEQNIQKIKLNCKAEGIVKAFSTNTNVA